MKKAMLCAVNFGLLLTMSCAASLYAQDRDATTKKSDVKPAVTTYRPQVVGVGSSAQFPIFGIAAVAGDPVTGSSTTCGTNVWSFSGNVAGSSPAVPMAAGIDGRSTSIPAEPGTISVVWSTATDSNGNPQSVCAYLSVDSVVGQRLMLEQTADSSSSTGYTNGYISLNAAATTAVPLSKISFIQDTATTGLPSAVYNIVNGAHFNVAFTDIRPEDGLFATNRALCNPQSGDTIKVCLGYGPTGSPVEYAAIESSYTANNIANVVPYSLPPSSVPGSTGQGGALTFYNVNYSIGVDPISSGTIPAINTIPVGEDPVLVVVNMTGTNTGSFKTQNPTNVNSHVLSHIYSGFNGQVADVTGGLNSAGSGVNAYQPLAVIEREPTSGTYNTFEWQAVRDRDAFYGNSQELNNPYPTTANSGTNCTFTPPASASYSPPLTSDTAVCANPLFNPIGEGQGSAGYDGGSPGSFRARAIGTGEMLSAINSANNPDSIGYAFWSLGAYGGKTNIKYLTVDGVDPLYCGTNVKAVAVSCYNSNGLLPGSSSGSPNSAGGYCSGYFNASPTFGCTDWNLPSLANVANGNYRLWSTLRAIVDTTVQNYQVSNLDNTTLTPATLIQAAQDQASKNVPDFIPWQVCANSGCSSTTQTVQVFRSHYGSSGSFPQNGILAPFDAANSISYIPEGGGDMNGAPFNISAELDIVNWFGTSSEVFNVLQ